MFFLFEDYLTPISSARQDHLHELLDNLDLSDFMYPLTLLIDSHFQDSKIFLFFSFFLVNRNVRIRGKLLSYIIWKKRAIYVRFSNAKETVFKKSWQTHLQSINKIKPGSEHAIRNRVLLR
ncbi:hypothetical protein CVD25_17610 [Bacillus canaveralius]|uniref:Uncharacterized protein n=1 Tax=Bacillus canaveralius TaxID=1403243 RepID=A0A2N5GQ81_9BACI|nr:hypothetical protein CU635_05200 [Bacillus canaveralius]PLR93282.1 hypothetical protein CVD25_17610 [Bacillus canaveralius]